MADQFVNAVDDGLAVGADVVDAAVEVENPAQRLLRWRDVVALGAEADDRRGDVAQVDPDPVAGHDLGRGELVADEQVVDDPLHLLGIEEDVAAPPFLEAEIARALGVDLGVELVLLAPKGVGRVHVLEILDQGRAVEDAMAQIARECRQPAATIEPTRIAHRVLAVHAGPIGQRRTRDDHRAEQLGPDGGHQHDGPAALAVADHHGLAVGVGMQLDHPLEERRLGSHDVLDRLPRHRLGQEAYEVTRMAGPHRDADLAVGLEPADPRPMPGTRVDHDERPLLLIDDDAGRRGDADQPIVRRPRQLATVHHELGLEVEHMRCLLGHVLMVLIAALAQDVEEQDAALPRVHGVVEASGPGCHARCDRRLVLCFRHDLSPASRAVSR